MSNNIQTVNYLGPKESFSYLLASQVFNSKEYILHPCQSFTEVINQTKENEIGLLPIENSITSDIHENIDALFQENFYIIGEGYLKINLSLVANKNAQLKDIRDVYSHPRALLQCNSYISKHGFRTHETMSTSDAVQYLKDNAHNAVIGSNYLGKQEGVQILERNIGNVKTNMTRFVFISTNDRHSLSRQKNKATIIFKVLHEPGALSKVLGELAKEMINITKIESRPIPGTNWEYNFWIDIEDNSLSHERIKGIFVDTTTSYRILGIYEKGKTFDS